MLRLLAPAVGLAILGTTAHADDGFYAALKGGAAIPGETDLSSPDVAGLTATSEFDTGFMVGGAVGYRWSPFRVETELSYRQNDIDEIDFGSAGELDGAGDVAALTGFVNAFYDVDLASVGLEKLSPYVGGGIGVANLDTDSDADAIVDVDDSDTAFAWNVQAGIAYAVTERVELGIGYRYLATGDASFDVGTAAGGSGTLDTDGFQSHEVLASVGYNF